MTHWTAPFLGIPHSEQNCWQLVRNVYCRVYGIELPEYAEHFACIEEVEELAQILETERKRAGAWHEVPAGQERTGDVVALWVTRRGGPTHVGVVVEPGLMLHAHLQADSVIEDYGQGFWKRRVVDFSRHRELLRGPGFSAPSLKQGEDCRAVPEGHELR